MKMTLWAPTWIWVGLCLQVALAADNTADRSAVNRPVSSRELEELRMAVSESASSNIEGIFDYHAETGDVNNRLDYLRYGAQINYRAYPGTIVYLRGTGTSYRTLGNVLDEQGVNLTGGIRSRVTESVDLRLEAGATRFTTDSSTVNALGSVTFKASGGSSFYLTGSRTNVEETLLSASGIRPVVGPFAGRLVGQVMDNRFVAGARINLPKRFDVFGEGGGGTRTGSNIESNPFRVADGGIGYRLYTGPETANVTLVRASYQFDYLSFDKNLLGFGGASLVDRRGRLLPISLLGGDGISPLSIGGNPGAGGYFSPQQFISNVGRLEVQGRPRPKVEYRVAGFAGAQDYTGLAAARAAAGFTGTVTFRLSGRLSLPISYLFDNVGPFQQHTVLFRLMVKL